MKKKKTMLAQELQTEQMNTLKHIFKVYLQETLLIYFI